MKQSSWDDHVRHCVVSRIWGLATELNRKAAKVSCSPKPMTKPRACSTHRETSDSKRETKMLFEASHSTCEGSWNEAILLSSQFSTRKPTVKICVFGRTSVPSVFGAAHIMGPLAEFKAQYPELTLEVDFIDRRVDLLAEGYDLAIRAGDLGEEGLTVRRIASAPRFPCASAQYLVRRGSLSQPEELAGHDGLIYAHHTLPNTWTLSNGEREVKVTYSLSSGIRTGRTS